MKKNGRSLLAGFGLLLLSLVSGSSVHAGTTTQAEFKAKLMQAIAESPRFKNTEIKVILDPRQEPGFAPGWAAWKEMKKDHAWQLAGIAATGVGTVFLGVGAVAYGVFEGAKRAVEPGKKLGHIDVFLKLNATDKAYAHLYCEYSAVRKTGYTEVYECRTSSYDNNLLSPNTTVTKRDWPKKFLFSGGRYENTSNTNLTFIHFKDAGVVSVDIVRTVIW